MQATGFQNRFLLIIRGKNDTVRANDLNLINMKDNPMEFGSLLFMLRFLPAFMICYALAPGRMKNFILLLGSLCFYAWGRPLYLIPLVLCVLSDFVHGLMIEQYRSSKGGGILLCNAVLIDLAFLVYFGYADFLTQTVNSIAGTAYKSLGFVFPVGLMVYTLQMISYLVDVYRGKVSAIHNFIDYMTYVSSFPQLAGGPVIKYHKIEKELKNRRPELSQISFGAKRACIGLAKKVLLADAAGELWTEIETMNRSVVSVATAWLGIFAFAFHLYFSFSGYADIARGLAACMGFHFPDNFDHPFAAVSVTDFCNRWNITLTKWFREYVYEPLKGSPEGNLRQCCGMVVMGVLMGLWYGADWTFFLWGLWISVFLLLEKHVFGKVLKAIPRALGWIYTVFVMGIGWAMFALKDMDAFRSYLERMFGIGGADFFDRRFLYLGWWHFPLLIVSLLSAIPLATTSIRKLGGTKTGACMALYRLGEKIFPPVLLILSLIYLAGRG